VVTERNGDIVCRVLLFDDAGAPIESVSAFRHAKVQRTRAGATSDHPSHGGAPRFVGSTARIRTRVGNRFGSDCRRQVAAELRIRRARRGEAVPCVAVRHPSVRSWISVTLVVVAPVLIWSQFRSTDNHGWRDAMTGTVAALVGMVPEGLVLLTSLAFVIATVSLARRSSLVQELPAVESLARVDVVCLDKTGTLT
jgi:hypothetical protein